MNRRSMCAERCGDVRTCQLNGVSGFTRHLVRGVRGAMVVCGILLACGLAKPATADGNPPYEIYLRNSQGVLVDQTATCHIANEYVYDNATNTLIGIASYQKGHVYDLIGNDIGLLVANS